MDNKDYKLFKPASFTIKAFIFRAFILLVMFIFFVVLGIMLLSLGIGFEKITFTSIILLFPSLIVCNRIQKKFEYSLDLVKSKTEDKIIISEFAILGYKQLLHKRFKLQNRIRYFDKKDLIFKNILRLIEEYPYKQVNALSPISSGKTQYTTIFTRGVPQW